MLETDCIETQTHACALLEFLEPFCQEVAKDAKDKRVILQQPVHVEDAVTACQAIEDHLESIGFGHLLT